MELLNSTMLTLEIIFESIGSIEPIKPVLTEPQLSHLSQLRGLIQENGVVQVNNVDSGDAFFELMGSMELINPMLI